MLRRIRSVRRSDRNLRNGRLLPISGQIGNVAERMWRWIRPLGIFGLFDVLQEVDGKQVFSVTAAQTRKCRRFAAETNFPESFEEYLVAKRNCWRHSLECQQRLGLRPFGKKTAAELAELLSPQAIEK